MAIGAATRDDEIRERAIRRLKKRRDFYAHVLIYVMVNTFLVAIWALTSADGFFWPIFPMVGWGIGVVMNGLDALRGDQFREGAIRREIERMDRAA